MTTGIIRDAANTTSQVHIPWHDGNPFSMYGAEVGVLHERDEVGLACLLEGLQGISSPPLKRA